MKQLTLCATCMFGVESLVADELRRLKMTDVRAQNGRVLFSGGMEEIARANLWVRTAERVMILAGEFAAPSFDALFEGVRAIDWEAVIPKSGAFPVKGHCLSSALHSVPDCQAIIKKAVSKRLGEKYGLEWLPEDGAAYQIRFTILKDTASVYIDTSGPGLHKRGYRAVGSAAPLRETLAAAMVSLARFRGREAFIDPFCGSGTIPIEAALIALGRAPGLKREFACQAWSQIDPSLFKRLRQEARDAEFRREYDIAGSDIDPKVLEIANSNAEKAGVSEWVRFTRADAADFSPKASSGVVVTNPPYGQRVMDTKQAEDLYRQFGAATRPYPDWKLYILSSHTEFERAFGRQADKKRKLYNGMIKCDLFMYIGGMR